MRPAGYASSVFLDGRVRLHERAGVEVRLRDLLRVEPPRVAKRAGRFIFHMGHACSTLLSRAIEALPGSLVLREPLVMRQLARWEDARRPPPTYTADTWRRADHLVQGLLAKTYAEGDLAVIKPSSLANGAMRTCLVERPSNRAVFLYRSLPSFLATMLRTRDNRQDGLADLTVRLRARPGSVHASAVRAQPIVRRLAALWMLHVQLFLELLPLVPASRLLSLDADDFLSSPSATLAALGRAFGFSWSPSQIALVGAGALFSRDAKRPSRSFDAGAHAFELARTRAALGDEIADAIAWCTREMSARATEALPRPLLGSG